MKDEIEPLHGISTNERTPTIESITALGDFRFAQKAGRSDLSQRRRIRQKSTVPNDKVALSAVAQISLMEEEGMSVSEIAADLGISAATVLTDLGIAADICHPSKSNHNLGKVDSPGTA
jgi:DNA-binding CsgD family transcriptional regulator